ncbi:hypothetical protein [Haloplanus natans]|uniref:hypothetical protein n=1 Tax=Haloplanus natans TaxID=376171 RepID=UPI00146FC093|nr:hypothetical protein [Haloplanus natans]
MDPRDTPGYHVHRALSTLRNIETGELSTADTHRIQVAAMLLTDVSFLQEVEQHSSSDK